MGFTVVTASAAPSLVKVFTVFGSWEWQNSRG